MVENYSYRIYFSLAHFGNIQIKNVQRKLFHLYLAVCNHKVACENSSTCLVSF